MKNLTRLLFFVIFLGIILVGLNSFVFSKKIVNSAYGAFYQEKENSLDLVFVGSSTVKKGIVNSNIWHDYGFTSYSINRAPTHPEVIKIAIDEIGRTQSPKVVYVDLVSLVYQTKENEEKFVKEYIVDVSDDKVKNELILKYNCLDMLKHEKEIFSGHNNYRDNDYLDGLFVNKWHKLKGYNPSFETSIQVDDYEFDYNKVEPLSSDGEQYLIEILKTCKKYPSINFLFGMMPKFINEHDEHEVYMLNYAKTIIESYGYKYINWCLYNQEIGLDASTDMQDLHHMNVYGSIKFTTFFINYLQSNYSLVKENHSESVVKDFNEGYEFYKKTILKKIKN